MNDQVPPPVPSEEEVDNLWAERLGVPPMPPTPPTPPEQPEQLPEPENSNPGNSNPYYGSNREPETQLQEPMPSTCLVWSVLATVFCCLIPGIIAIVFSSSVSSRYYAGDIEGARRASDNAQIWIIISFVLGLVSSIVYLPLMFV